MIRKFDCMITPTFLLSEYLKLSISLNIFRLTLQGLLPHNGLSMNILLYILCLCPGFIFAQSAELLTTYLSWQKNPDSTMTIHWITSEDDQGDALSYRELNGKAWTFAVGNHRALPDKHLIHITELKGLKPNTIYEFKIGNRDGVSKFKTMPSALESPIRFVVGGDVYHDSLEVLEKTNRRAAKESPMFALIGGDIAYAYTARNSARPQRWLEFLTSWSKTMITPEGLMIPIIPAVGNHDVNRKAQSPEEKGRYFYSLFAMPGAAGYNVLDFGRYMTILLLDSGHAQPVSGAQTDWLRHALALRNEIPHKFALYHVPAWPSVKDATDKTSVQIRLHWVPIFEKYGLDVAFENHNHAYKRTPKIYQGQVDQDRGVLYLGDGAWGVDKVRTPKLSENEWYLAKTAKERHFILVTLDGRERHFLAINADGAIFDELPPGAAILLEE
jgi:hypothetical protein